MPTELWLKILTDRMSLFDTQKKGWVLEGFPETREQAMALQINGVYPKHCSKYLLYVVGIYYLLLVVEKVSFRKT